MDYSAFLKLDEVRGESRTSPWVGWIPLFSASGSLPGRTGSPGGKPSGSSDVFVVAPHGVHSASLFKAAADGKAFQKGEIAFVRNGSRTMTWKLEDVFVAGFQLGGAAEGVPLEAITLASKELTVSRG
jgi:type VI protein secretion system component Hcp